MARLPAKRLRLWILRTLRLGSWLRTLWFYPGASKNCGNNEAIGDRPRILICRTVVAAKYASITASSMSAVSKTKASTGPPFPMACESVANKRSIDWAVNLTEASLSSGGVGVLFGRAFRTTPAILSGRRAPEEP